jgi:esterase/lipase superfamily enzyme
MLVISYRKDFWSTRSLAEHDAIREVDPQTGVEAEVTEEQFSRRVRGKRLMLLLHGYRSSREDVLCAYGQLDSQLSGVDRVTPGRGAAEYQEVIGVSWPGHDWRIEFTSAKAKADATAPKLFARLRKTAETARAIDVITHSLGARVALRTLQNAGEASRPVRNLFLTGAAVDDESIGQNEKFFYATERSERVYVLHSKNDPVLEFFYPIPVFGGGGPALGHKGPKHPSKVASNVSSVDCSQIVAAHSDYRKRAEFYDFVATAAAGGPVPTKIAAGAGFVEYDCPFEQEENE